MFEHDEHIHGAGFGEQILLSDEPKNLLAAMFLGLHANVDSGAVVAAHFVGADAARERADEPRVGVQTHWLEACREVRTGWRCDYVE